MIFVHDKGRMANNILQYGHFYAWGRAHGRQTMSMRFAYKYPYFHICKTSHHNFLTYAFAKYAAKWRLIPTLHFDEKDGDYRAHEQQMLTSKLLMVTGWEARWYDAFLKYKPEIIELFAFNDAVEQQVKPLLGEGIRLGVHIRRGDYVRFYGGRFFYSDEQYVNVIRNFVKLHENERITVYICGNDPKLNRDYYREQLGDCRVVFPDGNPGEDLCLLSHCHYLIGAPSTFTLVASLYHETPLYWIENPVKELTSQDFKHFDDLFRHIY
ncbi:alpha-1,2-fucosyltransferase [Prevotella sp. P6B4]|uniref:alpha-1,2-fucosyltransferase n=1 Tax=Prevotella sp. P6B4 TaxID=1410614 RepID=UPI00048CE0E5|nr:alpha-1,2-fucosyltransferase [Prevotella sp. P6B4]